MKFEKIAELAGDITISEEMKQNVLRNCKREYLSQQEKSSHMTVYMTDYLKKENRAQ